MIKIPVEVSARHIHISKDDLEFLFGSGFELEKEKSLTQGNDFAAKEKVNLIKGEERIEGVRILGPLREETQVEISRTDAYSLKMNPPLRLSGDLEGSGSITIEGPVGRMDLGKGVIVAKRHLHCNPEDAKKLRVKNGDSISVKIEGERSLIFNKVIVRVDEKFSLSMHIDTDEGNAAGIEKEGFGTIVR
jgi:putative phosphotransacetylase